MEFFKMRKVFVIDKSMERSLVVICWGLDIWHATWRKRYGWLEIRGGGRGMEETWTWRLCHTNSISWDSAFLYFYVRLWDCVCVYFFWLKCVCIFSLFIQVIKDHILCHTTKYNIQKKEEKMKAQCWCI